MTTVTAGMLCRKAAGMVGGGSVFTCLLLRAACPESGKTWDELRAQFSQAIWTHRRLHSRALWWDSLVQYRQERIAALLATADECDREDVVRELQAVADLYPAPVWVLSKSA